MMSDLRYVHSTSAGWPNQGEDSQEGSANSEEERACAYTCGGPLGVYIPII